jgi:hypothetical protein
MIPMKAWGDLAHDLHVTGYSWLYVLWLLWLVLWSTWAGEITYNHQTGKFEQS